MGHYDSSRPGYCARCGAAPGNMVDGVCEFCRKDVQTGRNVPPRKPAQRAGHVPDTAYEPLTDYSGTAIDLLRHVTNIVALHGPEARVYLNTDSKHIQVVVK